MQIDLKTVAIKPLRNTYAHVARRLGSDKPASRYQEGTLDLQSTHNFHYRPTWDPEHEIFDTARTRIQMKDWYAFKDPRQFYYGAYTQARARQQESTESAYKFVEGRGLVDQLSPEVQALTLQALLPLRHAEFGANLNNAFVCAYGYGTALTQPCMFYAMDHLGNAQLLTRLGLLVADATVLDDAKAAWLNVAAFQGLRRLLEDLFVLKDPFEVFVAQNAALDGLLYPLLFDRVIDGGFSANGNPVIAMLTQPLRDWFAETRRWVDATIATAAAESPDNAALLSTWMTTYQDRARSALLPVAELALGQQVDKVIDECATELGKRFRAKGLSL